ncbi:MAG: HD-GYP domain-containing protein [Clostridiales Family XIII bacterium]|jgi:HD-GYP domain-containing protein (c-di-GMP phosphodiesterase class II)|nr:HD-GYP domain-containing protein [Clostridiales Family XIII bacterium]
MRFVTVAGLKKGMLLSRDIMGENCKTLFTANTKLKQDQIEKINKLGFSGAYVEDALCGEILPEPLIPQELYAELVLAAKDFLTEAQNLKPDHGRRAQTVDRQKNIVTPIIDFLLAKKRRLIDYIDQKPYKEYEYYHAANGMLLSLLLGIEMGMDGERLYELGLAALLHDIGAVFLPAEILNRPGTLTDEEFEIIKSHTERGFAYLHDYFRLSEEAAMGALQHHENYDGTGYPNGLKRKQISLVGRIIAVTDVYDALVSRRPFRSAMFAKQGLEILEQKSDRKFDPDIVDLFAKIVAPFPSGVTVQLSNGETAIVFRNHKDNPFRPRLIKASGEREYLDLAKDPEMAKVKIRRIVE